MGDVTARLEEEEARLSSTVAELRAELAAVESTLHYVRWALGKEATPPKQRGTLRRANGPRRRGRPSRYVGLAPAVMEVIGANAMRVPEITSHLGVRDAFVGISTQHVRSVIARLHKTGVLTRVSEGTYSITPSPPESPDADDV